MDSLVVESVQCKLGSLGVILWPSFTGDPPPYINDEDIHNLDLRIFPRPNLSGPCYEYKYHNETRRWYLA